MESVIPQDSPLAAYLEGLPACIEDQEPSAQLTRVVGSGEADSDDDTLNDTDADNSHAFAPSPLPPRTSSLQKHSQAFQWDDHGRKLQTQVMVGVTGYSE